ncbi:MAG: hypothetical protein M1834_006769 [Cirrosporium novae-zelandiae]|nr:MAG: hypothetical protein M1834_006769 [Cirrosporium novae-zelandiae]
MSMYKKDSGPALASEYDHKDHRSFTVLQFLPQFMTLRILYFCFLGSLALSFTHGLYLPSYRRRVSSTTFPSLINATAQELKEGLDAGLFTSYDLVKAYIARINEVNDTLHVVTEINPDAYAIAAELDKERANGTIRGPLHGIPLLIKNNIATDDKMNNTAGSYALLGAKVPRDSGIAAKLRKAGVIILGKSNLSQWANFRSSNSSNGWSAHGGQVYAAYYPQQDPSGSSSGSAVASSLGLALAALGTETSGSILSPCDVNNLVGIKPTVGLTSRSLVIPISPHQDTIGPMARTVRDAALILSAIAGPDSYDNATSLIPFRTIPDYTAHLNETHTTQQPLKGIRLGIPRNVLTISASDNTTSPAVLAAFNTSISTLRTLGATIIDNANWTAYAQFQTFNASNLYSEFVSSLADYLASLTSNPQNITSLSTLRTFTQTSPLEEYPNRDTYVWDTALALGYNASSPRSWHFYQEALYLGGAGGLLGALKTYSLDAMILPTQFSPGVPALVGTPVVTVPMGAYPAGQEVVWNSRGDLVEVAPNVPFGLSFMGESWSEERLIRYAYAFEQAGAVGRGVRPLGEFVPETEVLDVV